MFVSFVTRFRPNHLPNFGWLTIDDLRVRNMAMPPSAEFTDVWWVKSRSYFLADFELNFMTFWQNMGMFSSFRTIIDCLRHVLFGKHSRLSRWVQESCRKMSKDIYFWGFPIVIIKVDPWILDMGLQIWPTSKHVTKFSWVAWESSEMSWQKKKKEKITRQKHKALTVACVTGSGLLC